MSEDQRQAWRQALADHAATQRPTRWRRTTMRQRAGMIRMPAPRDNGNHERPRPRGTRRTPSRRYRAPADPYGTTHRKIRQWLLSNLAAAPGQPCRICGRPMYTSQNLHLHHSDPTAKLAGLPGDQLVHAGCNMTAGGRDGAA